MSTFTAVFLLVAVATCLNYGEGAATKSLSARIVQGSDARDNAYPFQVSLRESNRPICGGAILTRRFVVTAAHCVVTPPSGPSYWKPRSPSDLSVRVGSTLLNSGGSIIGVSRNIPHPRYSNMENDIALLKLSSSLKFGISVAAIPIATVRPPTNAKVDVVGWGDTSDESSPSERLQYLKMKVVSDETCESYTDVSSSRVLCLTGGYNSGVCYGDSGGAAIYENTLVGLTSFGLSESCTEPYPDAFTMVPNYANWLRKNSDLQ